MTDSVPIPRSLPRGRHAAAREVVLASQRGRLLEAIAACVAEQGYAATTVAHVIARAGVSRKTFYEHFADKDACFLAAWEAGFELVLSQVAEAVAAEPTWQRQLRAGAHVFLEVLAAEPDFARTFLIEVLSAGEGALERRAETHRRFAAVIGAGYRAARADRPELGPLPDFVPQAAAGAVWELTFEHVRTRGVDGLMELAPQIEQIHEAFVFGRYAEA
ncbi:TetR/AcrR family transcriptional regulator [Conexibacter stalactiti]|uniref:TetR/AcrR family transcriptional regulator n=1 Tax=Conexibacter stalactiti TaxID=1940611 RepID=A0ABU4HXF6_9ACTN|nr:TetR/AcrR family transcriptional regulator [Conexibacter stalactiti]MDW5598011.1 TetR/AcrR family transcriptional regulator [Conexibacter stalactiti]MEC5038653.1 TetR/AcrR family transcriptional regulator [Conexibacter stalactiti]